MADNTNPFGGDAIEEDNMTLESDSADFNTPSEEGSVPSDDLSVDVATKEGGTEESDTEENSTEEGDTEESSTEEGGTEEGDKKESEKEPEKEPAPKQNERSKFIPRNRFDKVNDARKDAESRARAHEAEIAELRQQLESRGTIVDETAGTIENLELSSEEVSTLSDAILDGNAEMAQEALQGMLSKAAQMGAQQARQGIEDRIQSTIDGRSVNDRMMDKADELTKQYPVLNEAHEDYDDLITDEVVIIRDAFISKQMDPVAALEKAVGIVAREYGLDSPAPTQQETPAEDTAKQEQAKQQQSRDTKNALDKVAKQPPLNEGGDNRGSTDGDINLEKLTDEEFDALPESTLARLRGDL